MYFVKCIPILLVFKQFQLVLIILKRAIHTAYGWYKFIITSLIRDTRNKKTNKGLLQTKCLLFSTVYMLKVLVFDQNIWNKKKFKFFRN